MSIVVTVLFTLGAGPSVTLASEAKLPNEPDISDQPTETADPLPPESTLTIDDQDCREMTDSIVRLFNGFFDRDPTDRELSAWADQYRTGQASLPSIAQELLDSDEFALNYGKLDDAGFVDLLYANTVTGELSNDERNTWVNLLMNGQEWSTATLAFTESIWFVEETETVRPLAGFGRWYPDGTHWYCGEGTTRVDIVELSAISVRSDFLFANETTEISPTEMWVRESNLSTNVLMTQGDIPGGFTDFNWDGLFSGDGNYGNNLEINTAARTRWIVVFYPTSIGERRDGWELQPDEA